MQHIRLIHRKSHLNWINLLTPTRSVMCFVLYSKWHTYLTCTPKCNSTVHVASDKVKCSPDKPVKLRSVFQWMFQWNKELPFFTFKCKFKLIKINIKWKMQFLKHTVSHTPSALWSHVVSGYIIGHCKSRFSYGQFMRTDHRWVVPSIYFQIFIIVK